MLVCSLVIEGAAEIAEYFSESKNNFGLLLGITGGGLLAFIMVLVEFQLVSHTSILTLSIAGIFKEILQISTGIYFFGDKFNFMMFDKFVSLIFRVAGLIVSLVGIFLYNQIRTPRPKPKAATQDDDFELHDFEMLLDEESDVDS